MGVHTYVMGDGFPTIYGGWAIAPIGHITHHKTLDATQQQRWPWMKNTWSLDNNRGYVYGWFRTLREAKEYARKEWPSCYFKTPKQFRDERDAS